VRRSRDQPPCVDILVKVRGSVVILVVWLCVIVASLGQLVLAGLAAGQADDRVTDAGEGSFARRCHSPDIIRCIGFDSEREVGGHVTPAWDGMIRAQLDPLVKASGKASLRFEIPSESAENTSGTFWVNFSDDLSVQFGPGQEFYVQWRQRFSADMLSPSMGGGGWKQIAIGEGDRRGFSSGSCTDLGIVMNNNYYRGFPQLYHSCGRKDGRYEGFVEPVGAPPRDFLLQNAIREPGCLYSLQGKWVPPCHGYKPDTWMTFQIRVKVGTWYRNDRVYRHDSVVQAWVADETQPARMIVDFSPRDAECQMQPLSLPSCQTGYDLVNLDSRARYGKVWLMPYNTGKSVSRTHPTAYTWYDELIISRSPIADP
jgi:hypothetical protein